MKIKKEFWELIKSGQKNIELRKIENINTLNLEKGRFDIRLRYPETSKIIGKIIINGYKIIKNIFNLYEIPETFYHNSHYRASYGIINEKNYQWIKNNWNWLTEYFKNEDEILVLYIESFENYEDK